MKKALLPIILIVVLTGCDKTSATDSNLTVGLNQHLARLQNCIGGLPSIFPTQPRGEDSGLDVLTEMGMVTKAAAPNPSQFVYDLTSKGKDTKTDVISRRGMPSVGYLCSGKLVVEKIVNFTEPAEHEGVRQTGVSYITKLVDVPDWAKDPRFLKIYDNFEPIATRTEQGYTNKEMMILTHEGWKVQGDM